MKANTFVKVALFLVALTALFYWQDVWAWVSAKSAVELAGDILGFALKWFYLALLAFLLTTIPHYIKPWLRVWRKKKRQERRHYRFDHDQLPTTPKAPRFDANRVLASILAGQLGMTGNQRVSRQTNPPPEETHIELRF